MPLIGRRSLAPANSAYDNSQPTLGGPTLGPFATLVQAEVKTGNSNISYLPQGTQIGMVHCYQTSIGFEEIWVLFDLQAYQGAMTADSLRLEWAGSSTQPWGPALRAQHKANALAEGRNYHWYRVTYQYQPLSAFNAPSGTWQGHSLEIAGAERGRMLHRSQSSAPHHQQHWVLHPLFDTPINGTPFTQVAQGTRPGSWVVTGAPGSSLYVAVSWNSYKTI